jgi:hypothetical protein
MQGKNIQPTATLFDKKGRLNQGFALRKNQGIEMPMAPPTVASAMYLKERVKIVVHVRVREFGNRQDRDVIKAAERQPVRIRHLISLEPGLPVLRGIAMVEFLIPSVGTNCFEGYQSVGRCSAVAGYVLLGAYFSAHILMRAIWNG